METIAQTRTRQNAQPVVDFAVNCLRGVGELQTRQREAGRGYRDAEHKLFMFTCDVVVLPLLSSRWLLPAT